MSSGQVQQFGLRAGLLESVDPKQQPPGTLQLAENCIRRKSGLVEKRIGTNYLSSRAALTAGARLLVRGTELAVTDGTSVWTYSQKTGLWSNVGPIANVGLTWETLLDMNDGVRIADLAQLSDGRIVVAWTTGDASSQISTQRVLYQIIDRSTGETRTTRPVDVSPTGSTVNIRVIADGSGNFAIVMGDATSTNLRAWLSATSGFVTLAANIGTGKVFDAVLNGAAFTVVYERSTGGVVIGTWNITTGAVVTAAVVVVSTGASFDCISVDGLTGESMFVGYVIFGTGTVVAVHNAGTLAQTLAPTTIAASATADGTVGVCRYNATTYVVVTALITPSAGGLYPSVVISNLVTTAGVASGTRYSWGVLALTRPFLLNGVPFVYMADYRWQTTAGTNSYLVAIETTTPAGPSWPHRLVGIVDVLAAGEWPQPAFGTISTGWLPNVIGLGTNEILAPLPFQAQLVTSDILNGRGPVRFGARLVSATVAASLPPDMWRSVTIGAELYASAGAMQAYDGVNVFDYGFHQAALIDPGTSTTSTTGGSMSSGAFIYSLVPEYRSQAGMLHRGPTCPGVTLTVGGAVTTGSVTVKYVQPNLSPKRLASEATFNPVKPTVAIYRSKLAGTTLYRETVLPGLNVSAPSYTSSPQTYTDTRADTDVGNGVPLASQAPLYTTGGNLDDFPPSAFYTQVLHRNRIYGITGDRSKVAYSKDWTADIGIAPGFHPTFLFAFNDLLTALGSMEDKLVGWSASRIWFVPGDGPNKAGQGATYEPPIPVQSDVGCISGRSVVAMPDGLMFQSARGIYLLTRGLEVAFVGRPVQDELANYPTVTSAVLVASRNEVRFTCNNAAGTAGIVLVYDYLEKQWATSKYTDTTTSTYGTPIADAAMWNGAWTFITPNGAVFSEKTNMADAALYLDAGATWVPMSFTLASVTPDGVLGYQRMRKSFLLGDRITDTDLTLAFDYDDKGTFPQTYTWRSDLLAALMDGGNVGMRCGSRNGANPRCRAFAVRVTDAAPTGAGALLGTGKGCTFSAVGYEVVPKPGPVRRSAHARA